MPSGCSYLGAILLLLLFTGPGTNTALAFAFAPSTHINSNAERIVAADSDTFSTSLRATTGTDGETTKSNNDRRRFLASVLSTTAATATAALTLTRIPSPAAAADKPKKVKKRYVLDDETGDYVEVIEDGDWQTVWKSRADQMQTMSRDEIFQAARGAGNVDSKNLENESPASKRRRAFSGCRDKATRAKLKNIDEKSCSQRVLGGEIDFVLEVL